MLLNLVLNQAALSGMLAVRFPVLSVCMQNCKRFVTLNHFFETADSIALLVGAFDKFIFPEKQHFPIL